jgi:hypothetical protein
MLGPSIVEREAPVYEYENDYINFDLATHLQYLISLSFRTTYHYLVYGWGKSGCVGGVMARAVTREVYSGRRDRCISASDRRWGSLLGDFALSCAYDLEMRSNC